MPLVSFSSGQVISSSNVNANFGLCVLTDTSRTITVTHTYSASQTFSSGWTAAAACTISSGGLTTTGVTISTAVGKIIPGATSLSLRNNADGADNILITDAGLVTVRGAATFSAGVIINGGSFAAGTVYKNAGAGLAIAGITGSSNDISLVTPAGITALQIPTGTADVGIPSGSLTLGTTLIMSQTASRLIPGSTSFSHRNNANSADNLLITDAGVASFRSDLKLVTNAKQIYGRNAANSQDVIMMGVSATDYISIGNDANQAGVIVQAFGTGSKLGFYASTGATKQTVSGSRGANAALASLLTALAAIGLVVDSSS